MFRLTFKNLWANKIRFALTTFGVTLAVSFVVSAFVLGDGLRSTFTQVSEDITAGIDLEVRNTAEFGESPPLPASTVSTIAAVDGVTDAVAVIEGADNAVRPTTPDGGAISTSGPPQLAFNWIDNPRLSAFTLVDGTAPAVGEFTLDVDSAALHGFTIGETYELATPAGPAQLTLSGTTSFGAENATLGAVLMQMNTAQASDLFGVDGINSVAIELQEGIDAAAVRAAVQASVSQTVPTAEVVDHATVLEETTSEFTDQIDLVGNILLGFAGVALFVSIFIIYNTFGIVLSQRTRELALLRAVGTDPNQIRRAVIGEALLMGVLASAAGIGGGVMVARGIDALFGAMGVDLSEWPLIVAPRTLIAAAVVGVGVTVVAAIGPARRAASIPPIVAIANAGEPVERGSRSRLTIVAGLFLGSIALAVAGLAGVGSALLTVAALSCAAMAIFIAVTMASALLVGVVTRVVGWPLRQVAGVAGRLAQRNAARNARRTSTTAAALMIGLTVVSMALVAGESVKATIGSTIEHSAKADYFLTDELDEVRFPATLAAEIRQSPTVDAVAGFTPLEARVDDAVADVVAVDFTQIDAVLDVGVATGAFSRNAANPVVVSADAAAARRTTVGDSVTFEFANGGRIDTTIVGVFDDQTVIGEDFIVDTTVLDAVGVPESPEWIAFSTTADASPTAVTALADDISGDYPYAAVETAAEFRDRMTGMVDKVLTMVNVMVGLAVIIALIGIANTLALSVFERTRELGLLRAVGMSRRQLRRMIRLEAALVAMFGATLGVGLGLLFGAGVVSVLPSSFAAEVAVPVGQIAMVVAGATAAAVVAAWLPARRASRLDVLGAIAH
jgi:putative ABC transport system permease protein